MTPILLLALVTLSWFVPTTRAIECAPGSRYVHPRNCSAFIMCNKYRKMKIFKCPTGLHYNAMKSFCDWPEDAKCTLEEKGKPAWLNSTRNITAVKKVSAKDMVQKTKADENIRTGSFTYKDAVIQKGRAENETRMVELGVLNRYQSKEYHNIESMKEVTGDDAKVKITNGGAKEGVEKSAVKGKAKETTDSGALTNIGGTSENKSMLEVKSGNGETEEQASTQETPERDAKVNKPGFFSRHFHAISKRQDQTETKQEEIKKKSESKNEGEKLMTNNKLLTKLLAVEVEKSNMTEVKNVTFKVKELDFSNKSLIGFVVKKNNTGEDINNKELSEEPIINSSDVQYFSVPFNFISSNNFGYIIPIDTENSTSDSSSDIESPPPTSENAPKIENAPTSESSPTSEDTSNAGSEPRSKIVPSSTSEPSVGKQL